MGEPCKKSCVRSLCGARSTQRTLRPSPAMPFESTIVFVVLPVPPFALYIDITRISLFSAGSSRRAHSSVVKRLPMATRGSDMMTMIMLSYGYERKLRGRLPEKIE